jgi:putative ABC transport system ATP-binding protein
MKKNQIPLIISAHQVRKTLTTATGGELSILEDINLEVNTGEAVAILGCSGSGKSTLLGLLAGLDAVSSGVIHLLGKPLGQLDEDQRAHLRLGQVGFVFQSFQLMPGMCALDNVCLPLQLAGVANRQAQAIDLLKSVGLGHRQHHLPTQLSGGEQQRVALARAFAGPPKVLFADEPTGNLDSQTSQQIENLLFDLRDQHQTTLILVTHDQQLAKRCDRILHLQAGRLS